VSRLGLLLLLTFLSACATQTICDYVTCVDGAGGAGGAGGTGGGGGAP
jgi:hypothetical protein